MKQIENPTFIKLIIIIIIIFATIFDINKFFINKLKAAFEIIYNFLLIRVWNKQTHEYQISGKYC